MEEERARPWIRMEEEEEEGGSVRKTDSVVYGILIFGGVVLTVLAFLTSFAGLPSEVTLAFVGTVLGGTIATIAQKLGKI